MSKTHIVYSRKVANELLNRGCKLKQIERNVGSPKFLAFRFEINESFKKNFPKLTTKTKE